MPIRQRIAVRPEPLRHRLVDDRHAGRAARVLVREGAAADDRNLEGAEVGRRDRREAAAAVKRPVERAPFDDERQAEAALQRHAAGGAGDLDAGQGVQPLGAVPHQLRHRGRLREPRAPQRHAHRQHLCASKPGSTARSATNVRMNSAAPTSSTSASPISLTTSSARALFCRNPLPERPLLSLSVVFRSARDACSAGTRPKTRPVSERDDRGKRQHAPVDADAGRHRRRCAGCCPGSPPAARGCRPCRAPARARRPSPTARRSRSAAAG